MEEGFGQFRVLGLGRIRPIGNELALVAPTVVDGNRVAVYVCAASKVIHHELPSAGKVPHGKGHFGIDGCGVAHERGHRLSMPDEIQLDPGIVEVGVDRFFEAFGCADIGIREHQLQNNRTIRVVLVNIEPERSPIGSQPVIAQFPHPPVLMELLGVGEVGKAPVIGELWIALDHVPDFIHVGDKLEHGLHVPVDVLGKGAFSDLRLNTALQVAGSDLGSRESRNGQKRHRAIPGCRDGNQSIVCTSPFVLGNPESFGAEPVRGDQARGSPQSANDMGKLLFGPVGGENLIEAEQVGFVRFALQLVAVPGEAQANFRGRRIAGLANARGGSDIFPCAPEVGKDVFKPVESMLNAIFSLESPNGDVPDPCVDRMQGADDIVVAVLLLLPKERRGHFCHSLTVTCESRLYLQPLRVPGAANSLSTVNVVVTPSAFAARLGIVLFEKRSTEFPRFKASQTFVKMLGAPT